MTRSEAIFAMILGLLLSIIIVIISIFADNVASFRMKNRKGQLVEVFRPSSATWISRICLAIGFIGIVASFIIMLAYRSR